MIAEDAANPLDTDEVMAMIAVLMFAGHETTSGLLGNAIVALANHPDQRQLLRSKPELIDNAVEELVRFDSPVQTSGRVASEEMVIGGKTIRKGATIALMIGAAVGQRRGQMPTNCDLIALNQNRFHSAMECTIASELRSLGWKQRLHCRRSWSHSVTTPLIWIPLVGNGHTRCEDCCHCKSTVKARIRSKGGPHRIWRRHQFRRLLTPSGRCVWLSASAHTCRVSRSSRNRDDDHVVFIVEFQVVTKRCPRCERRV